GAPTAPAPDLAGGRLVLFDPDGTLRDGAAAINSHEFFDDDNCPPWDCWVLYVADPLTPEQQAFELASSGWRPGRVSSVPATPSWRTSYVVSWVAPPLHPLAHAGVEVNPESCSEVAGRSGHTVHAGPAAALSPDLTAARRGVCGASILSVRSVR